MVIAWARLRDGTLGVAVVVVFAGVGGAIGYEAAVPDVHDSSNATPPPEGVGLWFGVVLGAAAGVAVVVVARSFAAAAVAVGLAGLVAVAVYGATLGESARDAAEFGLYVVPASTVAACALGLAAALVWIGAAAVVRRAGQRVR